MIKYLFTPKKMVIAVSLIAVGILLYAREPVVNTITSKNMTTENIEKRGGIIALKVKGSEGTIKLQKDGQAIINVENKETQKVPWKVIHDEGLIQLGNVEDDMYLKVDPKTGWLYGPNDTIEKNARMIRMGSIRGKSTLVKAREDAKNVAKTESAPSINPNPSLTQDEENMIRMRVMEMLQKSMENAKEKEKESENKNNTNDADTTESTEK